MADPHKPQVERRSTCHPMGRTMEYRSWFSFSFSFFPRQGSQSQFPQQTAQWLWTSSMRSLLVLLRRHSTPYEHDLTIAHTLKQNDISRGLGDDIHQHPPAGSSSVLRFLTVSGLVGFLGKLCGSLLTGSPRIESDQGSKGVAWADSTEANHTALGLG